MRNRQMVVRWLMANTKAIDVRQRDGKTFYVMTDATAFREGVGRLLAEVQRIKSTGDYAAAKALFEAHGVHFDPQLRDQVVARVRHAAPAVLFRVRDAQADRGQRRRRHDRRRVDQLPDGPGRPDAGVGQGLGVDPVSARPYRAGQSVDDHCRACHEDRIHTVIVVDVAQQPLRVSCDFCGSEHNYRGGPRHVGQAACRADTGRQPPPRPPASGVRADPPGQRA